MKKVKREILWQFRPLFMHWIWSLLLQKIENDRKSYKTKFYFSNFRTV